MPVVPDTKDWTWVLQRRCPECGYDASATTRAAVPGLIRDNAAAWRAALGSRDVADLRTRTRPRSRIATRTRIPASSPISWPEPLTVSPAASPG